MKFPSIPRISFIWTVSFIFSVLLAPCNGESLLRRGQQSINATQAPPDQSSNTTTNSSGTLPPHTENSTEAPTTPDEDDDEEEDKPFTIIFVSDLENKYRGHDIGRSQYVINYIRDLKDRNFVFNQPYSDHYIDPKLVIHGGDISHMWSCDNNRWFIFGGCRNPQDEYKDVWDRLYDAGIPMISAFGNHDWRARNGTGNPWEGESDEPKTDETDFINQWSNEFTQLSYEKSAKVTNGKLKYQEIYPTGSIGESMYRATYGGIQIVNFNSAHNWQSYDQNGVVYDADDQFDRLNRTLDRSLKTIFFSHYPLNSGGITATQTPPRAAAISLIREFGEGVAHFSGHFHVNRVYPYTAAEPNFNDYVAPYPHTWNGDDPGFLAILMSRRRGVLQVKTLHIPGLEDGDKCTPFNFLNIREVFYGFLPATHDWPFSLQSAAEDSGTEEASSASSEGNSYQNNNGLYNAISEASRCCNTCKAGKNYWSSEAGWFLCGANPEGESAREETWTVVVPDDRTFREEDGVY